MANLSDLHGRKPRIAVHKFSSCDGCQLALLNAGEDPIELSNLVDIVHFLEAGLEDPRPARCIRWALGWVVSGRPRSPGKWKSFFPGSARPCPGRIVGILDRLTGSARHNATLYLRIPAPSP